MHPAPRNSLHPRFIAAACVAALTLAVPALALPLLHSDYQSYLTGSSPRLVVTGDLNGDGCDDIVVADGDGVAYFLARGDQTFEPAQRFLPDVQPLGLLLVERKPRGFARLGLVVRRPNQPGIDVDLYARVDAHRPPDVMVVTFASATDHVIVADVDGDGVSDLVANDSQLPQVWIAYGRHDGRFDAPVAATVGVANTRVAVGDIDGDGHADLIATNGGANRISRVLGLGSRRFGAPLGMPVAAPFDVIAVGDFNADGRVDLVVEPPIFGDGVLHIYYGNANGLLLPHDTKDGDLVPEAMAVADLDGDGRSDLVLGRGPEVFLRGRDGFADPVRVAAGAVWVQDMAVGDFDGDGRLDLAVVDGVALGCGLDVDGAATTRVDNAEAPTGVSDAQVSLHVWHGRGDGTFDATPTYPTAGFRAAPLLVDVDGDGRPDLVVGSVDGATTGITTWRGRAGGSFDLPVGIPLGDEVTALAAGDFGGDGHTELAVNLGFRAGSVALLRLRRDRTLDGRADAPARAFAHQMVVGDFDHDGRADLALSNLNGASVSILLARPGFGQWQVSTLPVRGTSWAIATADFDGDGFLDLAVGSDPTRFNRRSAWLFRGAGDGTFALADSVDLAYPPLSIRGVDVDGDGRPDLVLAVSTRFCFDNSTYVRLLPNTGHMHFGPPTDEFMEAGPRDATVADLTGDGVPDLVAVSGYGRVAERPGRGGFQFGELLRFGLPAIVFGGLEVADLDHDGRIDVVATDEAGVHVLMNQGATRHAGRGASNHTDAVAATAVAEPRLSAAFNPAPRGEAIAFDLRLAHMEPSVRIALYDVAGRSLAQRELGSMTAGSHRVTLDAPGAAGGFAPGLYFARATLGGRTLTARVLVLP